MFFKQSSVLMTFNITWESNHIYRNMNLQMSYELHRLYTFNNSLWKPMPGKRSACVLAHIGFYYSGAAALVVCYKCLRSIDCSQSNDSPKLLHEQLSPQCVLVVGQAADNVLLIQPEKVLRKFSEDASLRDAADAAQFVTVSFASSSVEITLFKKVFEIFRESYSRCQRRGVFENDEPEFIPVDRNNPDFERLRDERVRLSTFSDWPATAKITAASLAHAGFYYTGGADRVQCAFCRGFLRNWVDGDTPEGEHRRHFPDCSFLQTSGVHSAPVPVGVAAERAAIPYVPDTHQPVPAAAAEPPRPEVVTQRPRHPRYTDLAARVQSFDGKPTPHGQNVQDLASAGFFHVGPEDNVKCFFCDGGLKNWQPSDSPWEEHARWFPRCGYLVTHRDASYIRSVQNAYPPNVLMEQILPGDIAGTPLALPQGRPNDVGHNAAAAREGEIRYRFEPREIKARMDSSTVKAVLEMGYPRELVREAIQAKLARTGDDFENAASLVEAVLELQEQSATRSLAAANPPFTSTHVGDPAMETAPATTGAVAAAATGHNIPEARSGTFEDMSTLRAALPAEPAQTETSVETPAKPGKNKRRNRKRKPRGKPGDDAARVEATETENKQDVESGPDEPAAEALPAEDEEAKSLMEENRQLKEAKTCKVCMDEDVNIVFLPCGHLSCCNNCAPSLRTCPICRAFIRGTVRIFLS